MIITHAINFEYWIPHILSPILTLILSCELNAVCSEKLTNYKMDHQGVTLLDGYNGSRHQRCETTWEVSRGLNMMLDKRVNALWKINCFTTFTSHLNFFKPEFSSYFLWIVRFKAIYVGNYLEHLCTVPPSGRDSKEVSRNLFSIVKPWSVWWQVFKTTLCCLSSKHDLKEKKKKATNGTNYMVIVSQVLILFLRYLDSQPATGRNSFH